MSDEQKSSTLFPGLEDPKCVEAANQATARIHEAQSSCYRLMVALFSTEHGSIEPDIKNIAPFFLDDEEVSEDWIEEVQASIKEHREAYQILSSAMAGHKP